MIGTEAKVKTSLTSAWSKPCRDCITMHYGRGAINPIMPLRISYAKGPIMRGGGIYDTASITDIRPLGKGAGFEIFDHSGSMSKYLFFLGIRTIGSSPVISDNYNIVRGAKALCELIVCLIPHRYDLFIIAAGKTIIYLVSFDIGLGILSP